MTVMICRICEHVLDVYMADGGVELIHTFQDSALNEDHAPDPIPAPPGYRGRCDFCNERPEFILPVRDFVTDFLRKGASGGNWAACATCAKLIETNNWSGLVARYVSVRESRDGVTVLPEEVAAIRALHRKLRKNITGALRPIQDGECE